MLKVFVYGTLKRGFPNHYLLEDKASGSCVFLCKARTAKKYPLVVATPYNIPFMLSEEGKGNIIEGEVYNVDDEMLKNLDRLEDHPRLYQRTPIEVVATENGNSVMQCETYLIFNCNPELLSFTFLSSYQNESKYLPPHQRRQDQVIKYIRPVD